MLGKLRTLDWLMGRPLDAGIAYMVVTIQGGEIIELKGCADRSAAASYARIGKARRSSSDKILLIPSA